MSQINQPTTSIGTLRPTRVEVNQGRLAANFHAIREKTKPAKIMPVVKANAYGHGLVATAQLMESLDADYLGVAILEEGILLREQGITMPVLVLGGILGSQLPHFIKHNLTITASSEELLRQADVIAGQMGKTAKVHLKIDTGMGRIGTQYYHAESLLETASKCEHLEIEGIFSHFANSDEADLTHARLQIERFHEVLDFYEKHSLPAPPLKHMANSGAILQLPEAYFDIVRPGIMLYGIYPGPDVQHTIDVQPALSLKSQTTFSKIIKPGHPVGYGSLWETDHDVHAVTIPVGYGDGYFRRMTGNAQVIIHGRKYPVVGRISMDQIVVNIESDTAKIGDEVTLIGETGEVKITIEDLAKWAGTNEYEILTNLNTRIPRVYVR